MYVPGAGLRPGTYFLYDRKFVSCRIKKMIIRTLFSHAKANTFLPQKLIEY